MIPHISIARKNKLFAPLISMVMLLGLTISPAQASTIGSFQIHEQGGSSSIFNHLQLQVIFGVDPISVTGGETVFDLILTSGNVGQTYTISSGAEFDKAVGFLTNGINDVVSLNTYDYPGGGGAIQLGSESRLFVVEGYYAGTNGIDFAGYNIDNISLTINNLVFSTPGGLWTDVNFDATFNVNTVPIPAAVWLFGSGLLGLVGVARRKVA
jgi:hypothetical protein